MPKKSTKSELVKQDRRTTGRKPRDILLHEIQDAVEDIHGIKNWSPLVQMAIYASHPNPIQVLKDDDGNVVLGDNGKPVMLEVVDPMLRQRCLETVAQYVQPKLKAMEVSNGEERGGRFKVAYQLTIKEKPKPKTSRTRKKK